MGRTAHAPPDGAQVCCSERLVTRLAGVRPPMPAWARAAGRGSRSHLLPPRFLDYVRYTPLDIPSPAGVGPAALPLQPGPHRTHPTRPPTAPPAICRIKSFPGRPHSTTASEHEYSLTSMHNSPRKNGITRGKQHTGHPPMPTLTGQARLPTQPAHLHTTDHHPEKLASDGRGARRPSTPRRYTPAAAGDVVPCMTPVPELERRHA